MEEFALEKLKVGLRSLMEDGNMFLAEDAPFVSRSLTALCKLQLFDPFLLNPAGEGRPEPDWSMLKEHPKSFPLPEEMIMFYDDSAAVRRDACNRVIWKHFSFVVDSLRGMVFPYQEQKAMGYLTDHSLPSEAQSMALKTIFEDPEEIQKLFRLSESIVNHKKPIVSVEEAAPQALPRFAEFLQLFQLDAKINTRLPTQADADAYKGNLFDKVLQPMGEKPECSLEGRLQLLHSLMTIPAVLEEEKGGDGETEVGELLEKMFQFNRDASRCLFAGVEKLGKKDEEVETVFRPLSPFIRELGEFLSGGHPLPAAQPLDTLHTWMKTHFTLVDETNVLDTILRELSKLLGEQKVFLKVDALLCAVGGGAARFLLERILSEDNVESQKFRDLSLRERTENAESSLDDLVMELRTWATTLVKDFHREKGNPDAVRFQITNHVSFSCVYRKKFKTSILMRLRTQLWFCFFEKGIGLERSFAGKTILDKLSSMGEEETVRTRFLSYLLAVALLEKDNVHFPEETMVDILDNWLLCKHSKLAALIVGATIAAQENK